MKNTILSPNSQFLIEANLSELAEALVFKDLSSFERIYVDIQIKYLQSQVDLLKSIDISGTDLNAAEISFLTLLKGMRIAIRERKLSTAAIESFINLLKSEALFKGEIYFIAGMAYGTFGEQKLSSRHYKIAAAELAKLGCTKKSLKAHHNFVAAESRIHPEQNNTVEWHLIYKKARQLRDRVCAASALNNLAREYQILGSLRTALSYSRKAVQLMGENKNSLNYHLALLNQVDILLDLGDNQEATYIADEILTSQHVEVKSALSILLQKHNLDLSLSELKSPSVDIENLALPTWKERKNQAKAAELTELEARIIDILSKKRTSKFELIENLYGTTLDFETLDNRFKNLMARLRKKMPNKIEFRDGIYGLKHDRAI